MKSISVFRLAAIAAVTALSLSAQAVTYSKVVVFGDSLSDSGNNFLAGAFDPTQVITGNTYVPSATYLPAGTYSNGPVWASYFADALGLSLLPSLGGGTNYAFGGATTSGDYPVPGLTSQVGMFLGANGGAAASDALYVIAGGGNNARAAGAALAALPSGLPFDQLLAASVSIISNNASNFATDVGNMVDTLQAAGAQNIIVWNAPNLGSSPFATATGTQGIGTLLATTMNDALDYRLSTETGVKVFDLFALVGQVQANPAAYGFDNVSDACGAPSNMCDPSTALFWDAIHPTTKAHQLIAQGMLVTAVPEPQTYGLMALGLLVVGVAARRQRA